MWLLTSFLGDFPDFPSFVDVCEIFADVVFRVEIRCCG